MSLWGNKTMTGVFNRSRNPEQLGGYETELRACPVCCGKFHRKAQARTSGRRQIYCSGGCRNRARVLREKGHSLADEIGAIYQPPSLQRVRTKV